MYKILYSSLVLFFLFVCLTVTGNAKSLKQISKSQDVFFPKQLAEKVNLYHSFPSSWWNFIVIDKKSDQFDINAYCNKVRSDLKMLSFKIICNSEFSSFHTMLKEWKNHQVLRSPYLNDKQLDSKLSQTLVNISLLNYSSNREIFELILNDPLGTYEQYFEMMSSRNKIKLSKNNGTFYDKSLKRYLIPVQLNFSPKDHQKLNLLMSKLGNNTKEKVLLIGPHGSIFENRHQVETDLKKVSIVGIVALFLSILLLAIYKIKRLMILIPSVLASVALSGIITHMVFDGIHGLTLSFGAGIIGLSFDYGLHAFFQKNKYQVWQSNLYGLLTTLVVLIVIGQSSIKLIQQIALFSSLGLIFSFIIFYIIHYYYKKEYTITHLVVHPLVNKYAIAFSMVLYLGVIPGMISLSPDLSLRKFDFQSESTKEARNWLFDNSKMVPPLFQVFNLDRNTLKNSANLKSFADKNMFNLETIGNYLPPILTQNDNLETWEDALNNGLQFKNDKSKQFLMKKLNDSIKYGLKKGAIAIADLSDVSYLKHIVTKKYHLAMWFPKDNDQVSVIKGKYPEANSLFEIVSSFPVNLTNELKWMAPVSLLLLILVLFFKYKAITYVVAALLPFVTAIGSVFWAIYIFGLSFSFISLLGIVIICGLSLDYGIFAVDAFTVDKNDSGSSTALFFAGLSSIIGFFPLLFCKHVVLFQLGSTISLGIIGTLVGTFWGIPILNSIIQNKYVNEIRND